MEATFGGAVMNVRHIRLMLALFFLVAGVVLLVLRFGMPDVVAKLDPLRLFLGAILAIVLGAWNLMKWYSGWIWFQEQATPIRRPLQRDPLPRTEEEPNPEFDFSKPAPDERAAQ